MVIDLACGLGANLRALAPVLGGAQHWRLVDHDPALLAALPQVLAEWARRSGYRFLRSGGGGDEQALHLTGPGFRARVVCQRADLAQGLAGLDVGERPLITASALLDLVSAAWLQALLHQARAAHAAVLFSLSVDGRTAWDPADPDDALVHGLFSQHQRRDKGFGPALGPAAPAAALQQLASTGHDTWQACSDWVIDGASAPRMQQALIDGMADAALEQHPAAHDTVQSWRLRRTAAIDGGRLRVGHVDLLATPAQGLGAPGR